MNELEFAQVKEKLLLRLATGEITQQEYDKILGEILSHESSLSSNQQSTNAQEMLDTSAGKNRNQSMGDYATGAKSSFQVEPGLELGKFRMVQRLGRGGMGEVWKARDTIGERDVVIKILPPELSDNPAELKRVKESFQKVHSLNHENICPTYDLGNDERVGYFLVMQFLDALTLDDYRQTMIMKNGSFSLEQTIAVIKKLAAALDYAHAQKVIHRDIKPQNIMVSVDGSKLWLIDFGLAAEIQSSLSRVSQVQMDRSGTYPYMAPEQWKGTVQDAATDQYALAVVTYELLQGRLPFDAPDSFMLRQCVLNEMAEPIESAAEEVNSALAKAFAKDRKSRFASCSEFVNSLTNHEGDIVEAIEVSDKLVDSMEVQEQERINAEKARKFANLPRQIQAEIQSKSLRKFLPGLPNTIFPPEVSRKKGLFTGDPEKEVPLDKGVALSQIQTLIDKKKYDKAKWQLEIALNRNPQDFTFWDTYGDVLFNLKNYNAAQKAYLTAIKIKPEDHVCWNCLGRTFNTRRGLMMACACFFHAIELDPGYVISYSNLCAWHLYNQNFQEAVKWGECAVELDSTHQISWSNLTISYHFAERHAEAEASLQKLSMISTEDIPALNRILRGESTINFFS